MTNKYSEVCLSSSFFAPLDGQAARRCAARRLRVGGGLRVSKLQMTLRHSVLLAVGMIRVARE